MPWAAAAAVVAAGVSAYSQNKAANKAASASQNATDAAIGQQNLNYDRTATNLNPYINAGTGALGQLNSLNNGDYSGFQNSPDYKFALSQGLQGVDRSAAARGSLYSGGHSADLLNYAGGMASQYLGNYRNSLQSMAQLGYGASSNLGSIGAGQSAQIGGLLTGNATNQANAAQNQANNVGQFANQAAGAFSQYYGQQPQTTSSYGNALNGGTGYDPNNGYGYGGGTYNLNGGSTNTSPWQVQAS